MNSPHPYKLRPYHNPQNLDESLVPKGWRLRYDDEKWTPTMRARFRFEGKWFDSVWYGVGEFTTFIVPVAP